MRMNLRTFELVAMVMLILGLICSVSAIFELRIVGYILSVSAVFLLYQIIKERERRKKKLAFFQRMGRIIASGMAA